MARPTKNRMYYPLRMVHSVFLQLILLKKFNFKKNF